MLNEREEERMAHCLTFLRDADDSLGRAQRLAAMALSEVAPMIAEAHQMLQDVLANAIMARGDKRTRAVHAQREDERRSKHSVSKADCPLDTPPQQRCVR